MKVKEMLIDALPIIKEFAPTIAGAIGGPVGMAAGYVVPILANAFESHPTDLKNIANKIINDPNARDKLCMLETNHKDFITQFLNNLNDIASLEISVKLTWNVGNDDQG